MFLCWSLTNQVILSDILHHRVHIMDSFVIITSASPVWEGLHAKPVRGSSGAGAIGRKVAMQQESL